MAGKCGSSKSSCGTKKACGTKKSSGTKKVAKKSK